jgi:hypothetical protein
MAGAVGTWVVGRVREGLCGLHGHDNLVQFETDRIFLRCASCGHESPGWAIDRATVASRDTKQAPSMFRTNLIGARRVA